MLYKAGNLPIPTTNLKPDNKLRCPFRDRDDCKDYGKYFIISVFSDAIIEEM